MKHTLLAAALFLIASVGLAGAAHAAEPYEAFVSKYCIACHGPDQQEGELRIDQLSRDFALGGEAHRWAEVIERVNAGDMPPEGEPQPTRDEIATFVTKLDSLIKAGRAARMAARPPVSHYRLSREEYQNTVYDLLGVHYDPTKPGELNEDTLWHGYERIGSELTLSPSHIERYYNAAETVLDRALPAEPVETRKVRKTAAQLRYGGKDHQQWLDRFGIKRQLRYLMLPNMPQPREELGRAFSPNWFGKNSTPHGGLYRMRLQASGLRPLGGPFPNLRIGEVNTSKAVEAMIELDVTASEDNPAVYEVEVMLEKPTEFSFDVVAPQAYDIRGGKKFKSSVTYKPGYLFTHSSESELLAPVALQMFDQDGNAIFPTVIVDWIEWEGPLETEAERSLRHGLLPPDDATIDRVVEHLKQFAQRAWRRPVRREELDSYLIAYQDERDAGESTADAFRVAMKGVLTSRHFIYLVEGEPEVREHLNDWELASRLSYFLWSSMPDESLFTAAQDGVLTGAGLKHEVDRMLTDSRINGFIEDFSRQWLQLHRVGMFPPDRGIYQTYDEWLETSLRNE